MNNLVNEKDKNIFLKSYVDKFGFPNVLPMTTNYDDEIFERLMGKALQRNKPLTNEEIYEAFKNEKYDLVEGDNAMEEKDIKKIKELLNKYGAKEEEIENFMQDLADVKEDLEEDKQDQEIEKQEPVNTEKEVEEKDENEDYLFNAKNMEILKATEDGKRLIINAPKMAKDELERAIKKLLG